MSCTENKTRLKCKSLANIVFVGLLRFSRIWGILSPIFVWMCGLSHDYLVAPPKAMYSSMVDM